jgi:hypothetical protein
MPIIILFMLIYIELLLCCTGRLPVPVGYRYVYLLKNLCVRHVCHVYGDGVHR